ncbi:hypothetical protein BDR26DRAFT_849481 [Obelidium mucronatum]|nr:hypothetical protein BDR26DRAFT_849481 [Obelidium mucronatum]
MLLLLLLLCEVEGVAVLVVVVGGGGWAMSDCSSVRTLQNFFRKSHVTFCIVIFFLPPWTSVFASVSASVRLCEYNECVRVCSIKMHCVEPVDPATLARDTVKRSKCHCQSGVASVQISCLPSFCRFSRALFRTRITF